MSDRMQGTLTIYDEITRDEVRNWTPQRLDAYLSGVRMSLMAALGADHLRHIQENPPPWAADGAPAVGAAPVPRVDDDEIVLQWLDRKAAELERLRGAAGTSDVQMALGFNIRAIACVRYLLRPAPVIEDVAPVATPEPPPPAAPPTAEPPAIAPPPPQVTIPAPVARDIAPPASTPPKVERIDPPRVRRRVSEVQEHAPASPSTADPCVLDALRLLHPDMAARVLSLAVDGPMPVAEFTHPHPPKSAFHVFGRVHRVGRAAGFEDGLVELKDEQVSILPQYRDRFLAAAPPSTAKRRPAAPPPELSAAPAPEKRDPPPVRRDPAPAAAPKAPPAPVATARPVAPPAAPAKPPAALRPVKPDLEPAPPASDADGSVPWTDQQIKMVLGRLDQDDEVAGRGLLRSLYSSSAAEVVADVVRNPIAAKSSIDRARRGLSRVIVEKNGMAWVDYSARLAIARAIHPDDVPWIQAIGETRYDLVMRGKSSNGPIRLHDPR